jgi:hypothetical protein
MRMLRIFSLIILILLLAMTSTQAFADCPEVNPSYYVCSGTVVNSDFPNTYNDDTIIIVEGTIAEGTATGGAGTDILINNGTLYGDLAGDTGSDGITDGNDTVINNGTVLCATNGCGGSIFGFFGDDTVVNNGLVETWMIGGAGGDTLINRGVVGQDMDADGHGTEFPPARLCEDISGANTVINSGTVGGEIRAGCLNDTVILEPGANGGSDNYLLINGRGGEDTLVLSFDNADVDAAVLENASSGSITIDGETFEWVNFEHIVKGEPEDGRLNGGVENNARTAAVYCSEYEDGGVIVYGIDENAEGYLLFSVSSEDAHAALQEAHDTNEHVMIIEEDGQSLWALTSNELQVHDADGQYDFIFNPTICGVPLAD